MGRGPMVRVATWAGALALVAAIVGAPASAAGPVDPGVQPGGTTDSLWGWVTARYPTLTESTPAATDQGNSAQRIGVSCWLPDGRAVDIRFSLSYTR